LRSNVFLKNQEAYISDRNKVHAKPEGEAGRDCQLNKHVGSLGFSSPLLAGVYSPLYIGWNLFIVECPSDLR
jgi:hypothetical protein